MNSENILSDVLLLSENESLATLDKRALRDAGVTRVQVMTSGIRAARMLADSAHPLKTLPDVVICGQKLGDMAGEQFCAILRLHPLFLGLPVLLILPNDNELAQLTTLGCGASALLSRPYSVTELREKLLSLVTNKPAMTQLQTATRMADTKDFDRALDTYGLLLKPTRCPEDYFRVGMQCLQQNNWNSAINAFQRALSSQLVKGEAELGIACAWKGKGDQQRFRAWLARAADTFVQARCWHRARAAYVRLLKEDPSAKNPFLARARRLILQGLYDEAADALAQGYEVTPREQLCDHVAQTCLKADEPARMLELLEASLGQALGTEQSGLGDALRESLDAVTRKHEQHLKRESERRRQEMSRKLTEKKLAEKATAAALEAEGRKSSVPAVSAFGVDETAPVPAMAAADRLPASETQEAFLPPLSVNDATSDLFSGVPKLNEMLSVMKCTWKLSRRDKQGRNSP